MDLFIKKDDSEIETDCSQLEVGSADRFVCWQECAVKNHAKALSGNNYAFDVAKNNYQIARKVSISHLAFVEDV